MIKKILSISAGLIGVSQSLWAIESITAPFPPSYTEPDFALPEKIRQEQRLNELKKQIEEQTSVLTPKQVSSHLNLQQVWIEEQPCSMIQEIQLEIVGSPQSESDLRHFQFIINKLTHPQKHSLVGRCVGTQTLQNLVHFAQNEIIKAGYITTQITVHPQDLSQGKLILSIYPGRLGQIKQQGKVLGSLQLNSAFPLKTGDLLNIKSLDQGLENLRRIPNLNVDIQIVAAEQEQEYIGYSDLLVTAQPYKAWGISFNVDNSGSKSTGKYLGSIGLSWNNPVSLNDSLNVNLSHSLDDWNDDRNQSYFASYQLPFKNYELGMSYNWYRYDQYVAGYQQLIHYRGESDQTNLTLSRLLSRGEHYKTSIYVKGYHKNNKNFLEDIEIQGQRRKTSGWNTGIQHRQYLGNALLDLNLDYRHGTGAFNAQPAPEEQILDANRNPLPAEGYARAPIWSADLRYQQPFLLLERPAQYRLSWHGQYAPKILVPQDRFYIGGRYSVRGFDGETMLSGDNGHYLQQEISMNSPIPNTQWYVGIDQGWVNGKNSIPANRYLLGSVIGLRHYYQGIYLDAFIGHGLSAPQYVEKQWSGGFSLNYSY